MKINSQTQQKKENICEGRKNFLDKKKHTHTLFLNENERWYTHILIESQLNSEMKKKKDGKSCI